MLFSLSQFPEAEPLPKAYLEGNAAFSKQDYPRALELYRQALAEDPENAEFLRSIGAVHGAQNNFAEARVWLEKSCQAKSPSALGCLQLGRTHYFENNFEAALTAIDRSISIKNLGARAAFARAQVLDRLNRNAEADLEYRKALADSALRPAESGEIQLVYANFLLRQGKPAAALWQLDQALRKRPEDARIQEERNKCLAALDQNP